MVLIEVLAPGGNQDAIKMRSMNALRVFRQFCGAQISIAHLCQPNAASANYTAS